MPFGPSNVPISFQRDINNILAKKFDIFNIVYVDDIFWGSSQAHIRANQTVLDVLERPGFLSAWKMVDEVYFLNYII